MSNPSIRIFLAIVAGCCLSPAVLAQPGRDKDPLSWDRKIQRLFSRQCYRCHGDDEVSGDVNLKVDEDLHLILQNRRKWIDVLEVLRSGTMPPEDERQPSDKERKRMIDFLDQTLSSFNCDSVHDPGRPVLRRLNRTEYDNVVLDLTGLDLQLAESFPPDPTSHGFDNNGDSLSLTPAQVELYHQAAKTIVAQLFSAKQGKGSLLIDGFASPAAGMKPRDRASRLLTEFGSRAFRQPIDPKYVNRLLRIYDQAIQQGQAPKEAVGHCLTGILMSSRFLMRIEIDPPDGDSPYPVSDYELASRLSFFLWSRGPDETLLALAKSGKLHPSGTLRAQAIRLLKDSRSIAFVENFFFQWLDLRNLEKHAPDPTVFPEFDQDLRWAMGQEVRLLLKDIVQHDLPLGNLVDADFSYLNDRLADHYGIEGVTSKTHKRVRLSNKRRGGIITSAAFVMLQADPGRTNIPRRGNFISGQLLGDPAPSAPPNVPPLDQADDDVKRSLRETFELHRRRPECKFCHEKIDAIGFSLENYDAIGRWRDEDNGVPVDASGKSASGEEFSGPEGLKSYLQSREDELLRNFATKLLIYALGRELETSDECVIDDMMAAAKSEDPTLSSMIAELVTSLPFTHRKDPQE